MRPARANRFLSLLWLLMPLASAGVAAAGGPAPQSERPVRAVEGWQAHADRRLLHGKDAALGTGALRVLLEELWLAKADSAPAPNSGALLQQQLMKEDAAALAKAARAQGDAARGALVFYRPELACTRCHTAGEDGARLGPDLARAGKEATAVYLVESVLLPSKVIKKGYETCVITTKSGLTLTGLIAEEREDALVLRDAAQAGKLITVLRKDIDERISQAASLMPEGLVNALADKQEFLDLVRYLTEIAEGGPDRARQLRPAAALFAPPAAA